MRKRNSKQGFTLVEMLVTATIIGLLAAMGLVSYVSANRNARNAKRRSDLEQVRAALELYRTENSDYPSGSNWTTTMSTLNTGGYLTNGQQISDPRSAPYPQYTYNSSSASCSGYEICADLEPDTDYDYCLCNP